MRTRLLFFSLIAIFNFGCGDSTPSLVDSRPYGLKVPKNYDGAPTPLIVTLHGLGQTGLQQAIASGLLAMVDTKGFILAYPDGTEIINGEQGWNASCCDSTIPVNDVSYLRAVIEDVTKKYNVDPKQIYMTGYSNGAFMAHLFACEASDLVAAISVYAGTMVFGEETKCHPTEKVSVMHTHGNADDTIKIGGGTINFGFGILKYLAADAVVQTWLTLDGCDPSITTSQLDVDSGLPGDETTVDHYATCSDGRNVEFLTVDGGTHIPNLTPTYMDAVVDFLYSNPKI